MELYPSNIPRGVGDWLSEEIQSFDHPFPSDQYVPHSIVDVFPEIENALQVEPGEDVEPGKETIMVEIPAPSGTDFPAYVAIARGDAHSAMSNRWYCAWVDEYLSAGEASDSTRTAQALDFLESSQTDEATQGPSLNFAVEHEDIYNSLIEGDTEQAHAFVKACER
ncbi:hypothetical protein VR010_04040 [Actinomycetaceae bacterium L2_0104]